MTTLERLVYMINQIARNFGTQMNSDACLATADHVASFWDHRMKTLIADHLDAGGENLSDVARAALVLLRDKGAPPHQTRATEELPGASDAG